MPAFVTFLIGAVVAYYGFKAWKSFSAHFQPVESREPPKVQDLVYDPETGTYKPDKPDTGPRA